MGFKDLEGKRFGRLVVLAECGRAKNGGILWECMCDCGNKKILKGYNLVNNNTKSCGCYQTESRFTHGMSKHPLYPIWKMILRRCTNPKCYGYKKYGGRGIKVCKRWGVFESFYVDVVDGYQKGLTLDRPDNNGDYGPTNYRWIGTDIQSQNKRGWNVSISKYKGVSYSKSNSKWIARITLDYKTTCLGSFEHEEDAGMAYDIKAKELFGKNAVLNFPD